MDELVVEVEDPAFEVDYECKNCGADWTEQCESRTEIYKETLGRLKVLQRDHDHIGTRDCDYCHVVICPVCKLDNHVSVTSRSPVNE